MRRVFTFLVAHFIVLSAAPSLIADDNLAYLDRTQPVEKRVDDLLSRLTLDEKLLLIAADPTAGTSLDTPMIERLRIPRFSMTDGPHGANFAKHFRTGATAFPSGIGLASSWNTELIENVGRAIARETKAQGRNVILGPCINIHRTPFGGRNFESFSEDPYLASRMTVSYVHGVQSMGVVSCLKHFACNNQERDRMFIDVQVSERALHEIYLPAFRAGVQEGGAWFVMSAYNKLNGHWASENQRLLTDVLKKQWDFRGAVISDWGAVHSTVPTANAGLDLEMGGTTFFADPLRTAISHGEVPLDIIDDKVRRLLRVMMSTGLFDEPWAPRHSAEELYRRPRGTGDFDASMYDMPTRFDNDTLDGPENRALALQAAREGIVLLKNSDDILPLDKEWIGSLAVIGPNAAWGNTGGGGSSETKSAYTTTPLEGLLKLVGDEVKVRYELGSTFDQRYNIPLVKAEFLLPPNNAPDSPGLRGEYFGNSELTGEPMAVTTEPHIFFHWGTNAPQPEMPEHSWSARWTGRLAAPQSGTYRLYLFHHGAFYASEQGDGARLFINGEIVIDNWHPTACRVPFVDVDLQAGVPADICLEYHDAGPGKQAIMILGWLPRFDDPIERAVALAKESDAVLLCLGDNNYYQGENNDRGDIRLPADQEELVLAVSKANPKTIVALYNGSPFLMENWLDAVPAVVECWYPNQEGGRALAELLFGVVEPVGRLPVTIAQSREDYPDYGNYPGNGHSVEYAEDVFVGYRHFDRRGIAPLFPFGHGLSYTEFRYDALLTEIDHDAERPSWSVSCQVTNVGSRHGKETVQLYVSPSPAPVPRPDQELKAFQQLRLNPGESGIVNFQISAADLAYYEEEGRSWIAPSGDYQVRVGASSRDIRLNSTIHLPAAERISYDR